MPEIGNNAARWPEKCQKSLNCDTKLRRYAVLHVNPASPVESGQLNNQWHV